MGSITIRAEEDEKNEKLQVDVRGEGLDKKDFFGKSDPYLNFKRKFDDGRLVIKIKMEIKKKTVQEYLTKLKKICFIHYWMCKISKKIEIIRRLLKIEIKKKETKKKSVSFLISTFFQHPPRPSHWNQVKNARSSLEYHPD